MKAESEREKRTQTKIYKTLLDFGCSFAIKWKYQMDFVGYSFYFVWNGTTDPCIHEVTIIYMILIAIDLQAMNKFFSFSRQVHNGRMHGSTNKTHLPQMKTHCLHQRRAAQCKWKNIHGRKWCNSNLYRAGHLSFNGEYIENEH